MSCGGERAWDKAAAQRKCSCRHETRRHSLLLGIGVRLKSGAIDFDEMCARIERYRRRSSASDGAAVLSFVLLFTVMAYPNHQGT